MFIPSSLLYDQNKVSHTTDVANRAYAFSTSGFRYIGRMFLSITHPKEKPQLLFFLLFDFDVSDITFFWCVVKADFDKMLLMKDFRKEAVKALFTAM